MLYKKTISLFFISMSFSAMATDKTDFDLKAECTTKPTGWNNARNQCTSQVQTYNAPSGYVIVKDKVQALEDSGAGSEHSCNVEFRDEVEVIPDTGITQPRTMIMYAKATSPKDSAGARGWAKCSFVGFITKYQQK